MQIADLIKAAPDLMQGLQGLGLDDNKIDGLAGAIGSELGGDDGFDFTDLLSGLDANSFMSKIDANGIAEKVGLSPAIVSSALALLAPKIAEFTGGAGGLGAIGDLAKGLFGKK